MEYLLLAPVYVSFAYPNEWRVQDDGGTVNLFPPEEGTIDLAGIEITVQGFELAEGQDLSDWNNRMMELVKVTTSEFERNVRSSEITSDALRQTPNSHKCCTLSIELRTLNTPQAIRLFIWLTARSYNMSSTRM